MLLWMMAPALALDSSHLVSIGPEITYDQAGAWARVLPATAPDWHFLFAAGGEFYRLPMTEDLIIGTERQPITGRTDLDDHVVTPCPTGGYLMSSSAGITDFNDSGYVYRLDDGFQITSTVVVAESDPQRTYNDMALVCGDDGGVAAYSDLPNQALVLVRLADDGEVLDTVDHRDMPSATGGALLHDPRTGEVLYVGVRAESQLQVARFDGSLGLVERRTVLTSDGGGTTIYWPQAALAVHDRFLVAYMVQDPADGFNQDWGHVRLAVFDRDWTLLEDHQITDAAPPDGAMRPGLAVRDDALIVSYDRIVGSPGLVQPRLRAVALDLDGFRDPDTPGDSGTTDSGRDSGPTDSDPDTGTADSGDTLTPPSDSGPGNSGTSPTRCSRCSDTEGPAPPAAALLLFGLLPWRRRRP